MKKFTILIAAIALVCFSVPAMAADWNFYGNARMATFYVSEDLGDSTTAGGDDGDTDLQWDLQGNSRFGATIKAENISARIEMGINESSVSSRRVFGVWNFGAGKMKVGKDYTPVSQFISGQVFDGDLGLLGIGTVYGSRKGQISFSFGGFEIALINPSSGFISGLSDSVSAVASVTLAGSTVITITTSSNGDIDEYLPKIEASWGMSFDAFNFGLQGGFNTYSIEDVTTATGTEDVDVTSWTIGGTAGFNFGPGYVKAALSYGQNIGDAGWSIPGLHNIGGFAVWDGDDGTDDTDTLQGALVGGLKVSDMLSFELGGGYRSDDPDATGAKKSEPWAVYLQSVIALAPGVYIIPEVGYFDEDDDGSGGDAGNIFYLGGKWQINF